MFDLDGVLADFISQFTWMAGRKFDLGFTFTRSHGMQTTWNVEDEPGSELTTEMADQVWEEADADPMFWTKLLTCVSDGEKRDMHKLVHAGIKVLYCTSRGGQDPKVQSEMWIRRNGFPAGQVIVAKDKAEALRGLESRGAEILAVIDDRPRLLSSLHKAGFYTVARDWPYNRGSETVCDARVSSVSEFVRICLGRATA